MSEIRVLTKNSVDSDSSITSSHGGTVSSIWDKDLGTEWRTQNGNEDSIEVSLEIIFKIGSTETEFATSFIALVGNNFRDFKIERWDSSVSEYVLLTTQDGNTSSNLCITFNYILTSRIKFKITKTILPNREKKLCELLIARQRFVVSEDATVYDLTFTNKVRKVQLGNGSTHQAFTRFTTTRTQRYRAKISWRLLTRLDYDRLLALKNEGVPFVFYPESVQVPKEFFYVNWVNAFTANYTSKFKGAGYDLDMEVEEV